VNVVEKMKSTGAVIGGEGNGGVILPDLHFGRDALAGIALFLTFMARSGMSSRAIRDLYPDYFMVKDKMPLTPGVDVEKILDHTARSFAGEEVTTIDGVKIDFDDGWVHLRRSNTEPIIRIYSEAKSSDRARELSQLVKEEISKA
jgi:phosphomannomutase